MRATECVFSYSLSILLISLRVAICDECDECKKIMDAFVAGVERTSKKGFSGGNTHWEQQNIGSYATSEIRFDDIIAGVCVKSNPKCHEMLGVLEPVLDEWWNDVFKADQSKVNELSDFICVSKEKYCCPLGYFGKDCNVCSPCFIQGGACDGNGTRSGSGKCRCQDGYVGDSCNTCNFETHYNTQPEFPDNHICRKCHASCVGGCRGPEPSDCTGCAAGWTWVTEEGVPPVCKDIDECQNNPCESSTEYCLNTAGSHECHRCSVSCHGCHGPSSRDCINCRKGYHLVEGKCEDIDECSMEPLPCQGDGEICRNTPGSHLCECQPHLERHNGRCVAKPYGKSRKSSNLVERKSQKSSKIIWTVVYTKEFGKYVASLLAFGIFCWFMKRHIVLTLTASVAVGAFIYRQSIMLDTVFSKQL